MRANHNPALLSKRYMGFFLPVRRHQGNRHIQLVQHLPELQIMLFRQNLRGRHHHGGITVFHGQQHGAQSHQRLAGPDIPLKQAVHGTGGFHIPVNLPHAALLSLRQLKRQGIRQILHQMAGTCGPHAGHFIRPPSSVGHVQLLSKAFLQRKTAPRPVPGLCGLRKMKIPQCRFARSVRHKLIHLRFRSRGKPGQRLPYDFPQPADRNPHTAAIHGNNAVQMNGLLISFPDNFKIRMHHTELFPIRFHAPVYNHLLPGAQHPGYARHAEPQAGKTGLPQRLLIRQHGFHIPAAALAAPSAPAFPAHIHHPPSQADGHTGRQGIIAVKHAAVFIPARKHEQQIPYGGHSRRLHGRQLSGADKNAFLQRRC